jgi:major membrane immunogen (membrane-anchored lipoprotein)
MKYLKIIFGIIICAVLSGCIQDDTVIHLKADGSGSIEETVKLSNFLVESFQNVANGMAQGESNGQDKPQQQDPIESMIKEAKARQVQYGPEVKFVSATPIKTEAMSGYKVIYAFKDINTVRINQNPEAKTGQPSGKEGPKKQEMISFKLVKGPVSTLTITMPEVENAKKDATADKTKPVNEAQPAQQNPDPNAAEMLKMVFKDMSIRIALQVDGKIVKTNATYQDKSQVTLLDMQFGKIVENPNIFEKLNTTQPATIEEMKAQVKEIPGLKIEMNNPVEVVFE